MRQTRWRQRLLRWTLRLLAGCLLLLGFLWWSSRTQSLELPDDVTQEVRHLKLAGCHVPVTFCYPADHSRAVPAVVVAHGFTRSRRYMAGWGALLAAQGFLAAVPTQPALADHELNATALAELTRVICSNTLSLKVRCNGKAALMGHSMGGLTTLLASSKTSVHAWVGLDPVDMNGRGVHAARALKIPGAILRAEPEAWNMHGNARQLISALPGTKFCMLVRGGTHLDCESPTDLLGQLACGFIDPSRQEVFQRYAIAFLRTTLMDDRASLEILEKSSEDSHLADIKASFAPSLVK